MRAIIFNSKASITSLTFEYHFWTWILFIRFNRLSSRLGDWDWCDLLSNRSLSGLVWSESCSDSLGDSTLFSWKLSKLLFSFNVIISSSKALSLLYKSFMVCLIWLISCCKSYSVTSFCLFLNLSKVLDKLIIGLSNLGFFSWLLNKDFNLSVYFSFNSVSSKRLINSTRTVFSWFCLVRTVICLTG